MKLISFPPNTFLHFLTYMNYPVTGFSHGHHVFLQTVHLAKHYHYLIKYLYFYHATLIFKNLFLKYYIFKQSSLFPSQMEELIVQAVMKDLRMLFLLN